MPVTKTDTLVTEDGVPIEAVHLDGDRSLGIVVGHGFTLHWQRPEVWKIARQLRRHGGVLVFDFRGHGRSGGASTLGDAEVHDLDAAVRHMRALGYKRVVTVGFSMGASVVLRHAALIGGADAVVSVSSPGRWYYKGTPSMRRVHWAVEHKAGRVVTRWFFKTRILRGHWDPVPLAPADAAALISPVPLLIVHGDRDHYFPPDHAEQLYEAARQPKELWIVPGLGHAESAITPAVLDKIAAWAERAARRQGIIGPLAAEPAVAGTGADGPPSGRAGEVASPDIVA